MAVGDAVFNASARMRVVGRRRLRGLASLATALALPVILCAWGCGGPTAPAPASAERLLQERDIAEVVLRDFVSHLPGNPSGSFETICISVDHHDPTDDFVLHFSDHSPPIKKGSACATASTGYPTGRIIDSSTGADAVKLDAYAVTWDTGRHVTVDAEYGYCDLCGGVYVYDLVFEPDGWRVDHRTLVALA